MSSGSKSTHIVLIHLQLLFFLVISISEYPLASHGCQAHERRALLDFKLSLSDPSNRLSSWKNENCCRWYGIRCSSDAHVISINLRNTVLENYSNERRLRRLNGNFSDVPPPDTALHGKFIPPSLSNITHLEYLDLAFNDFFNDFMETELPHGLTKLTHLDLSNSNFSGPISPQFTNLTSLQYLDLSCTRNLYYSPMCLVVSTIEWVRGLKNLQVLSLSGVDLDMATNPGNNIAEDILYLANLKHLDLSECGISTSLFPIPGSKKLSRLSSIKLSGNTDLISKIPVEMANLPSLSILDVSGCGLQGSVPYLPQLTKLNVRNNFDLRPDLTSMFQRKWPKLQTLSISDANVSGPIPVSITNAPSLVNFDAAGCKIQGSLPSSISNLSRLQSLELSANEITGNIPVSFCKMVSLRRLDLSRNNIARPVPSCLTNLKNLTLLL